MSRILHIYFPNLFQNQAVLPQVEKLRLGELLVRIEQISSRSLHAGDILKTVVPKISQKNGDVNLYLQLRDLKTYARGQFTETKLS
jgi:hypothetical protein